MTKIAASILGAVLALTISGCNLQDTPSSGTFPNAVIDETPCVSSSSLPPDAVHPNSSGSPVSSSIPDEELLIDDVSISYMSLLSQTGVLSTTVTIVNNKADVVACIATCTEGKLEDTWTKKNIYFTENVASAKYTVPAYPVDDIVVFSFYNENSKLVLTKTLRVAVDGEGFTIYEEMG